MCVCCHFFIQETRRDFIINNSQQVPRRRFNCLSIRSTRYSNGHVPAPSIAEMNRAICRHQEVAHYAHRSFTSLYYTLTLSRERIVVNADPKKKKDRHRFATLSATTRGTRVLKRKMCRFIFELAIASIPAPMFRLRSLNWRLLSNSFTSIGDDLVWKNSYVWLVSLGVKTPGKKKKKKKKKEHVRGDSEKDKNYSRTTFPLAFRGDWISR